MAFIKLLSDIFVPIIPALVAGGLLMALNNFLTQPGLFGPKSIVSTSPVIKGLSDMIQLMSAAPFIFMPILVAISASKRFGANRFLGAAIGMIMTSPDLVHWKNLGLAINADTKYDSHGAYSGSARVIDDKLFLMYTGNHRSKEWVRYPYQIGAIMDKDNNITKLDKPMIEPVDHITEHFRDPQLLKHRDEYFVILGAQDAETKTGKISLFRSKDLKNWQDLGYLDFTEEEMGYMVECPNLVFVDDQPVLIFCPQGLDKKVADYENIYPNMYIVGSDVRLDKAKFNTNQKAPLNLDDGFDVYATQAFNAPNGKAYAISWIGLPDISYPTDSENWANCLSQVKELSVVDGELYQRPVPAMASLREEGTLVRR